MTEHLTDEELRGYSQRSLDAARLLTVDDHVAACPSCRERAGLELDAAAVMPYLKAAVAPRHLQYEELAAYADSRPLDAYVQEHLDNCPQCQADAADLRTFAPKARPRNQAVRRWTYGLIAAAIAAGLAVVMIRTPGPRTVRPVTIARVTKPALPADIAAALTGAMSEGRIDVPPGIAALGGRPGQLLGAADQAPKFDVSGPIGTATLSDRPEFRWNALPSARSYTVAVYDAAFNEVARSPVLGGTSWQPDKPLARGKAYAWQVTAASPEGTVTAPRPPAPEARFTILPEAEASRLAALREKYPEEHLALGVALGRAGAVQDAASELERAVASGQNRDAAAKLLASLRRTTSPKQ